MTATMSGIDQLRESVATLRRLWGEALDAGDEKLADARQLVLEREQYKLELWEADVDALPIDAYIIALDETSNYSIPAEDAVFVKGMRGVYLFDRSERVHCCELTPSYYLIHLYNEIVPTDKWDELDDYALNDLAEKYESNYGDDDIYVHCRSIERIIEVAKPFTVYHAGETGVSFSDTSRDEQLEALREHYCGNHAV